MKKTTDQAYEILEDAATNTNQWPRDKTTPVKAIGGTNNEVLNNLVTHVVQCFVLISMPNSIPKRRNYGRLTL